MVGAKAGAGVAQTMRGTSSHRDTRKNLTNQRIQLAASELFYVNGYQRTTIDQIAQAAGVRRSTLYEHFRDKDQILRLIADDYAKRSQTVMEQLPGPVPTRAQIRDWIVTLVSFVKVQRVPTILFSDLGSLMVPVDIMVRLGNELFCALAKNITAFKVASEPGPLREATRARAYMVLRELCWSCLYSVQHEDEPGTVEVLAAAAQLLSFFVRVGARPKRVNR